MRLVPKGGSSRLKRRVEIAPCPRVYSTIYSRIRLMRCEQCAFFVAQGLVSASLLVFAGVGALGVYPLMVRMAGLDLRGVLLWNDLVLTVGPLVASMASSCWVFVLGRCLTGLGVGVASVAVNLYIQACGRALFAAGPVSEFPCCMRRPTVPLEGSRSDLPSAISERVAIGQTMGGAHFRGHGTQGSFRSPLGVALRGTSAAGDTWTTRCAEGHRVLPLRLVKVHKNVGLTDSSASESNELERQNTCVHTEHRWLCCLPCGHIYSLNIVNV